MKHKKKIFLLLSMLVLTFGYSLNASAAETELVSVYAEGSHLRSKSSGQLSCSSYSQIRFAYSGEEQGVSGHPWVDATVKYSDGTSKRILSYKDVEGVTNGSTTYTLEKTSGTFQIELMAQAVSDDSHDESCGITAYGVTHSHSYTVKNTAAKYLKSAATHSSPAVYYYSCSCGATNGTTFTYGSAVPHDYASTTDNSKIRSNATASAAATYWNKCSCGTFATSGSYYHSVGYPLVSYSSGLSSSRTYNYGENLTLTATFKNAKSYQWYKNGSAISGATSNSLSLGVQKTMGLSGNKYKCIATGYNGNTGLNSATTASAECTITANSASFNPTFSASSLTSLIRLPYLNPKPQYLVSHISLSMCNQSSQTFTVSLSVS